MDVQEIGTISKWQEIRLIMTRSSPEGFDVGEDAFLKEPDREKML